IFVAEFVLDQGRQGGGHAAELIVAEGGGVGGRGHQGAVLVLGAFGGDDHAVAIFLHSGVHLLEELFLREGDFGEQNDMGGIARPSRREPAGGGDPAGVAAHHFEDEHLGGGLAHRCHVEAGLPGGDRHVIGDGAKAGTVV